jgi:hypothetical protein
MPHTMPHPHSCFLTVGPDGIGYPHDTFDDAVAAIDGHDGYHVYWSDREPVQVAALAVPEVLSLT